MKHILIASVVAVAALTLGPAAHAEPGGGATRVEYCHIFFPGSEGHFTITPSGSLVHSCRYPGPAQGGGIDPIFGVCFVTPAGNINCT